MSSKYTPLENYLRDLPATQQEVILSFEQIETILKSKLPSSAHEQSWWDHATEGNHRNTRAWSNAGWKVDEVNFKAKCVKLVRAATARSPRNAA